MELMQAVEHYATAMKLSERYGNKYGDMDAANNAWYECKKAADRLAWLEEECAATKEALREIHRQVVLTPNVQVHG